MTKTAIIIGAGIAGLSAGIALIQRGWRVQVLERSETLAEVGAGVQISPNGMHVLRAFGVADKILEHGFEPEAIEMRMGRSGRRVFALPLHGVARDRWHAPYVQIHRADLHKTLLLRLQSLQADAVLTGQDCTRITQDGVITAQRQKFDGDLIIGADGLGSQAAQAVAQVGKPRFTGCIAWRTTVDMDVLSAPPPPTACAWVGAGRHAVTTRLKSGRIANFVGVVERPDPAPESWRNIGDRAQALSDFAGWAPTLTEILEKAEAVFCWSLFDRAPLDTWTNGKITLLGDAAHPMLPSMAQGAVQAMEDAYVLAETLSNAQAIPQGLAAYQAKRLARTADVQKLSAANLRLFHRKSAATQLATYGPAAIVGKLAPNQLHRRYDWIYGHDVTQDG